MLDFKEDSFSLVNLHRTLLKGKVGQDLKSNKKKQFKRKLKNNQVLTWRLFRGTTK